MDPPYRLDDSRVPLHWELVPSDDGFTFRHRSQPVTVEAVKRTDEYCDRNRPWLLRCRERANEASHTHEIGRVSTEVDAVCALFDWMECIDERIERTGGAPVNPSDAGVEAFDGSRPTPWRPEPQNG
ncbi:hypothetical protein [Halopelagius longus]|uniref:Uncharacterized protein n=1 Tax=Halopelagius longus TaxID=1236180 RepID=A0A1H1EWT5_9EURY|nr:hypothetical protein [Halopelagius longus]RDI71917.1 hypothetical protein DWB78_09385 [Halopelagius longus]SDQ92979.1 hypothetical protein SAMN05216278_3094 [Halopelagius longus]